MGHPGDKKDKQELLIHKNHYAVDVTDEIRREAS